MTLSNPDTTTKPGAVTSSSSSRARTWYRPVVSPEHGVYVILLVSFITGAAAAQRWTFLTTLALVCAFAGFQAEHPLVLQIKQRRSWKPRLLLWGSLYAGLSLGAAMYLYLQVPSLLWIYLGAIAALIIDSIAVFYRRQKTVFNEILTFAAVCLAVPFTYVATTGTWTISLFGLWCLNTLFFSSTIFTVKLRKPKTASLIPAMIYHAVASLIILGLWWIGWLASLSAITFTIVLAKFSLILWQRDWYKTTQIKNVAFLETITAILFLATTAISLLPAHLAQ
ncbi:hypothetical protein Lepto7376_0462 [[Leptolyngbya] sp. PCC 7376]|uniref:YwiC-like family protein n=1 Tax=[Leptolyngbya] sp. PCC 7376 TaxID=111781 RepID=UPI00029EC919|nr:YwiC-like family protein [[Leptolyngbya] sp. PCC 7376]AFY36895.1 hypothetical protein Lepto7376_0462 [[Leptolyngbya] sp. PCC 7376]